MSEAGVIAHDVVVHGYVQGVFFHHSCRAVGNRRPGQSRTASAADPRDQTSASLLDNPKRLTNTGGTGGVGQLGSAGIPLADAMPSTPVTFVPPDSVVTPTPATQVPPDSVATPPRS